jgi:chaperonin cofactor prefoldin
MFVFQEIQSFPESTNTYPALGRAFVFRTLPESVKILEGEKKEAEEELAGCDKEMKYHERELKSCSEQLQEIMEERQKRGSDE